MIPCILGSILIHFRRIHPLHALLLPSMFLAGCLVPVPEVPQRTPQALGINGACFTQVTQGKPAHYRPSTWAVGILRARSLLELRERAASASPVISAKDVTDRTVRFTADPFMIRQEGKWHLFFEIMNCFSEQGDIAHAVSDDGITFRYTGVVLDENFHLSYPHVFEHLGKVYMLPESRQAGGIRLYEARSFPSGWSFMKELVKGDFADPSLFYHNGRWWIFAVEGGYSLAIYYADSLTGEWNRHRHSPYYKDDKSKTRPAGRVVPYFDRLVRFAQDNLKRYGHQIRAYEILELTPDSFIERELTTGPFLTPEQPEIGIRSWNGVGMHQIDAHQLEDGSWIGCIDGAGVVDTQNAECAALP